RVTADEKSAVSERLDVKGDIAPRQRITKDLFHDIVHGDDSFGAAEFVNHHSHSLGMSEKKLEQLQRGHRLGHKGGSDEFFGVMFRRVEQEQFHIDDPENLIGRIDINWDPPMTFLL